MHNMCKQILQFKETISVVKMIVGVLVAFIESRIPTPLFHIRKFPEKAARYGFTICILRHLMVM